LNDEEEEIEEKAKEEVDNEARIAASKLR